MARIAKITVYVDTTQNGQVLKVRTTGKRGPTLLNTISVNQGFLSQSPFDTAADFYHDVLNKAQTMF